MGELVLARVIALFPFGHKASAAPGSGEAGTA